LPEDIDDWVQAQQSSVVKIEINKSILPEIIKSKEFVTLLMMDLVWLSIDRFMVEDGGLEILVNRSPDSGTWIDFVRSYFELIFADGLFLVDSRWQNEKSEIKSKIQSILAPTLEDNLDKLQKAFEEKNE
jgi:hypothetical protein